MDNIGEPEKYQIFGQESTANDSFEDDSQNFKADLSSHTRSRRMACNGPKDRLFGPRQVFEICFLPKC